MIASARYQRARGVGDVRPPLALLLLPLLAVAAAAVAYGLAHFQPSAPLAVAMSAGLVAALGLTLVRYDWSAGLAFLLMGVVFVEPAPVDALLMVIMAVALVTGRLDLRAVPLTIAALLGLFLTLNLLSTMEARDSAAAVRYLLITAYLLVFAVWLAGFVDSTRRTRLVVRAYIAGAVAMALVTIAALYLPLPGRSYLLDYHGVRGRGLFEDPNVYGPFLIPAAVILVEELLRPRLLRAGTLVKLTGVAILGVGVVLSYSRAAWVTLVASLLVLVVVQAMRRGGGARAAAVLTVMVAMGVAAAATLATTGSVEFLEQRASFQSYDVERFGAQARGIDLAAQYPLGVGPGQFEGVSDVSTHSIYVRALAEQGVLGFFTILAILLATLVFAGRNAVLGRDTHGIGSASLLAIWVGLLINSVVIDTLHWRHLWVVAALIWAGTLRPRGAAAAPA